MRHGVLSILFGLALAASGAAQAGEAAEPAGGDGRVVALREKLEAGLRATRTLQADFVQIRKFHALDGEWRSGGRMALEDGRMVWLIEKPLYCCFMMTCDKVKQWDEDTGKVLELSSKEQPWLRVLYEGLQSWFRGDFAILKRDFDLSAADERTLVLAPKPGTFYREGVKRVLLHFSADFCYAERIAVEEKSGDVITILLSRVRLNEPLAETLWQIPPVLKKP